MAGEKQLVDLLSASEEELRNLPGVGHVIAKRLHAAAPRTEQELANIKGIGRKSAAILSPRILWRGSEQHTGQLSQSNATEAQVKQPCKQCTGQCILLCVGAITLCLAGALAMGALTQRKDELLPRNTNLQKAPTLVGMSPQECASILCAAVQGRPWGSTMVLAMAVSLLVRIMWRPATNTGQMELRQRQRAGFRSLLHVIAETPEKHLCKSLRNWANSCKKSLSPECPIIPPKAVIDLFGAPPPYVQPHSNQGESHK